jgi:DNA-binding NarL/FixJ family response regulator
MTAAYNELVDAGARPRRLAFSGFASLTPSERRVAQLVADGRKNAEIGDELLISVKTVECHLSSVYRKLAVDSRGALAAQWVSLSTDGDVVGSLHGSGW